jgi:FixJ family two-component response regulator
MLPFGQHDPVTQSVLRVSSPAKADPSTATVFIIDQDAAVRDALSISLRMNGFCVLSFECAGHFLRSRPPDRQGCLLVEFDLLDMTGADLIARLLAERINLPAVIMSARLRSPFLEALLPSGVATILQKPFGRDELLMSLRLAIGT